MASGEKRSERASVRNERKDEREKERWRAARGAQKRCAHTSRRGEGAETLHRCPLLREFEQREGKKAVAGMRGQGFEPHWCARIRVGVTWVDTHTRRRRILGHEICACRFLRVCVACLCRRLCLSFGPELPRSPSSQRPASAGDGAPQAQEETLLCVEREAAGEKSTARKGSASSGLREMEASEKENVAAI